MQIGIFGGEPTSIDGAISGAQDAAEQGFAGYWVSQIFGFDNLTVLAIVGREVPNIELGTAVVPTYPRHPMMMAQQALTVQAASGGRLALGIGLSHKIVIENMFGMSFDKPVRHMQRVPVDPGAADPDRDRRLHGRDAERERVASTSPGSSPCPVLVAALGPADARARRHASPTARVTWMTGPDTLGSYTVPTITKAAADAGRPSAAVGAALPVCVTDDVDGAHGAGGEGLPDLRRPAVLPGDARPRGCAGPEDARDHRRRGRGAGGDRPDRRCRGHRLHRRGVRLGRPTRSGAPGSSSAPCCEAEPAFAARAARGAGRPKTSRSRPISTTSRSTRSKVCSRSSGTATRRPSTSS